VGDLFPATAFWTTSHGNRCLALPLPVTSVRLFCPSGSAFTRLVGFGQAVAAAAAVSSLSRGAYSHIFCAWLSASPLQVDFMYFDFL